MVGGAIAQQNLPQEFRGKLYAYWGWNRSMYSPSDIRFSGQHYDFVLEDVVAKDRPSPFNANTYFNPAYASIPQYNFRIGYYFKENWDVSVGIDHMKYVVEQNQFAKITGSIAHTETRFDGHYMGDNIQLTPDFLRMEHTDGLNYLNVGLRRTSPILDREFVQLSLLEGGGFGALVPRTDAELFSQERHNEFILSGYGGSALLGLQAKFFNHFLLQTEAKGGYIHMPGIRTTPDPEDSADQGFFFGQFNLVFGWILDLRKT
ncbi:MAG TPA: hypothetical protein DCE41_10170 [Cytophagales bacterium]|nr:hypothetical protein [Cytophagales bacterium]HAA21034.1 hypothetical protein [Cytophagales bacterium]HAP61515.1 hypothetical protein [Cytophagales bacterium]